jgi:hypothetical protein
MSDIRERHLREAAMGRRAAFAFAMTLVGPAVAVAAMAGLRLGLWPYGLAWGLTVYLALPLTIIGALGAVFAVVQAIRPPRIGRWAAFAAVVVSGATLAAFARVLLQPAVAAPDVSTDPADPPGFSAAAIAQGAIPTAPPAVSHCAVQALPSQSAPGAAGYALQAAGFDIQSLGVNRAVGTRQGLWFGTTWDATIRIRPGRTDIRIAARDPAQDRGEACRLADRIATALNPNP